MIYMILCILLGLIIILFIWLGNLTHANLLYRKAKSLEKQNSNYPEAVPQLKRALAIYHQCYKLSPRLIYIRAINICQQRINDCDRFQKSLVIARNYHRKGLYEKGLVELKIAQQLFITAELNNALAECQAGITRQQKYEQSLVKVKQSIAVGNFKDAIALLQSALSNFDCQDGRELLTKLNRAIDSKNLYNRGLIAENRGNISKAIELYNQALDITPELSSCKIRLAIISLKHCPQQAIDYLDGIESPQANYLRGYAYSQLQNWQQANKEWRCLIHPQIKQQRVILKDLIERDRNTKIKAIEELKNKQELAQAIELSQQLIKQYGINSTIENNLYNYLQPALEQQIWQEQNWEQIASKMERIWSEKQDIKSLHNWAISTYYQAQINPHKLADLIVAWLTAIANIKLDPSLKELPWLTTNKIDFADLELNLKQILENAIDAVKDNDLEQYFYLRDLYRRDTALLSLREQNNCGIKNKLQLLILPNCYQRLKEIVPKTDLPDRLWAALYTDWGMAVAACLVGDIPRAIQIKPQETSNSANLAVEFVAYHEGYHYLQNQYWRKSIEPLELAKSQIRNNPDWYAKIDLVCQQQRKYIRSSKEHLEFSSFWYSLLESATASNYYVEHLANQIGWAIDKGNISFQEGLKQLKDLETIDPGNPFAANIIKSLEVNLQLEKINYLWQENNYEEAVILAKASNHDKVRFAVAEVCLEIVLHILQTESLTNESLNSMQTIAQWAYELCPSEASFQPVYSHLRRLGVYN